LPKRWQLGPGIEQARSDALGKLVPQLLVRGRRVTDPHHQGQVGGHATPRAGTGSRGAMTEAILPTSSASQPSIAATSNQPTTVHQGAGQGKFNSLLGLESGAAHDHLTTAHPEQQSQAEHRGRQHESPVVRPGLSQEHGDHDAADGADQRRDDPRPTERRGQPAVFGSS